MLTLLFNSALLGIGLAMDAFSVSLANGLNEPCMKRRKMMTTLHCLQNLKFLPPRFLQKFRKNLWNNFASAAFYHFTMIRSKFRCWSAVQNFFLQGCGVTVPARNCC